MSNNLGILYVVSTPIGNLEDISVRAVKVLKSVDFIAAEDTRVTLKLLNHLNLSKPMVSYFEHNKLKRGQDIVARIVSGQNCALVSDAGTPAISDPGQELCFLCHENSIEVVSIPGPCAAIAALSICGLSIGRFCFEGFLSTSKRSRREHLLSLTQETRTMVFYEAPHKLLQTLNDFYECFGNRGIVLCREITKIYEQTLKMSLSQAIEYYRNNPPRGEFVIVMSGAEKDLSVDEKSAMQDATNKVIALRESGISTKDAVKQASLKFCVNKNKLYNLIIKGY